MENDKTIDLTESIKKINNSVNDMEIKKDKKTKKKSIFYKMRSKWKTFSKKRKILIITLIALVLITISFLLYIFVFLGSEQKIVVAKDNFIYENGKLKLLDENDREIGVYECVNKDPELCYVAFETLDDDFDTEKIIDKNGKLLKTRSQIYENKYVFIHDNVKNESDKIILYDIKASKNEEEYYGIKSYIKNKENFLVLKDKNQKRSLFKISSKLEQIIEFEYDYLGMILDKHSKDEEIVVAKKDTEWFLIDFENNELTSKFEEEIKNYNDKYVILKAKEKYRVVEYKSIEVVKDLDFVILESDFAIVVKSNKLNLLDYSNKELFPEGIELSNDDYIKTTVVNDKLKIEEIKQSFTYEIDGILINITIYDGDKETKYSYNLMEGKNNTNFKNYSYFNGELYLYSDDTKTKLLGKYSCTNKNNIKASDSDYNNCYPAKDASNNLIIPMYYSRFIFIYDAASGADDNTIKVNLYDIKLNKILGNYIKVNTGNGVANLTNIESDSYAIATNKNNKLGLLKIVSGKVTKATEFDYDELTRINNLYLKAKKDGKNIIVSNTGDEDKEAFVGNYYRVKNDKGSYDVYTLDNKKVLGNSFAYVKLYDKFIAAVSDAKLLFMYDYNGTKMVNDNISVPSSTEFTITYDDQDKNIVYIKVKNVTYEYDSSKIPWALPTNPPLGSGD